MLLAKVLSRVVGEGQLTIIDAAGQPHRLVGPKPGPAVTMRVHDRRTEWRLLMRPRLAFGESYMNGTLTIEDGGDLYALLDLLGRNMAAFESTPFVKWSYRCQRVVRAFEQYNPIGKAQRNVAHHYDLKDELYDLFLDPDRQYSCAYFRSPDDSLEQAQTNKKHRKAEGKEVEIGGWGYVSAADGNNFDEGSVTVTALQGLRAARNAGIPVPKENIDKAVNYLEACTTPDGGIIYNYTGGAAARGGGSPALTAAAKPGVSRRAFMSFGNSASPSTKRSRAATDTPS